MSIPNRSKLGPGATRVMLTVLRLADEQSTVQLADIADRLGISTTTVQLHLVRLRDAGLVTWEDRHAGTLRPAAHLIPVGATTMAVHGG